MATQTAQYDHIGSQYDAYARTATGKRAECYTFFRMVGALDRQRVLDLACGDGFSTRLLKPRGAAQVIGVDSSPTMIRLAHDHAQKEPLGIAYQVGDAVTLPRLGPFDLGTAVYLLPYATSKDQLLGMFRRVYATLVAGGRFIASTDTPAFPLSTPHWTQYGVTIRRLEPEADRYACEAEFVTDPPFRVRWYQWHQAPSEWALQEAGFQDFAWYPSEVAPEDVARYGETYGRAFYDHCPILGLVCQK